MFLQGDLQAVFDALYHLGVIDPVLKMDWQEIMDEVPEYDTELYEVVAVANACDSNVDNLITKLEKFSDATLSYLAMEVAREFADFHSRDIIH